MTTTTFKRIAAIATLCAAAALGTSAQERYDIGQKVELLCDCFGSPASWTPGVIEEDLGSGNYRVRFGSGRSDYLSSVSTQNIRHPGRGIPQARQDEMRHSFAEEAGQYKGSVGSVSRLFDSTLANSDTYAVPRTPAEWSKTMQELAALDQLCTSKYAGMKNLDNNGYRNIFQMYATWCEMAAARNTFQESANNAAFQSKLDVNVMFTRTALQRSIDEPKNQTSDGIQELIFEPDKWKAALMKLIGAPTSAFPPASFAEIAEKSNELKSLIEEGAAKRSWEPPPFNRPIEQNMAKTKFLAYYQGSSVLKIGSSFTDWKMYKNSLGIPTNRFIRGWALLRIPGRPNCQAQEWIVKQTYAGGGTWSKSIVDSFGGGGVFMQCN